MRIFVYVEGQSDVLALRALLRTYGQDLRAARHAIEFIQLHDKAHLLRKIGAKAAEKLLANTDDRVVALPDLHPTEPFAAMEEYRHSDVEELRNVLERLVRRELARRHNVHGTALQEAMTRFHASALKYEMEMLLLAAGHRLGDHIGTALDLTQWIHPAENVHHWRPPSAVVKELFLKHSRKKRAYQATIDAPAVLRRAASVREVLSSSLCNQECPVFKGFLDWLAKETDVAAY